MTCLLPDMASCHAIYLQRTTMSLLRREPVLLAVAAVVIVLGVDIDQLTETVNRLLELVAVVGAGVTARQKVTPVGDTP